VIVAEDITSFLPAAAGVFLTSSETGIVVRLSLVNFSRPKSLAFWRG